MTAIENSGDASPQNNAASAAQESPLQLFAQIHAYGADARTVDGHTASDGTTPKAPSDIGNTLKPAGNLSGGDAIKANPDVKNILDNFSIDGGQKPDSATIAYTHTLLKALQDQAYSSSDAAFLTVASRLANDPDLAQKVTDKDGFITQKSIENIRLADQGSLVHQHGSKDPESRVLTDQERADLKFVADHDRALGTAGIQAATIGVAAAAQLAQIVHDKPGLTTDQFTKIAADAVRAALVGAAAGAATGAGAAAANGEKAASKTNEPKAEAKGADRPNVRASDTPVIDQDHFAEAAKRVLNKLDKNHDGMVTKDQLAKALQDPSFKGADAQALVALYQNFDKLHNLSKHEYIWNTASITPGDLDKFQSIEKERGQLRNETSSMKQWAHSNLKNFTQNGSDTITKDDIDRALKKPNLTEYDRSMLQLVQKHYGEMDSLFNFSGLSAKDFDALDTKAWSDDTGKLVSGVWGSCYSVANDAQKAGTSYDLYATKDPLKSITPDAVRQGAVGDCYYEAVVASLAKANPALLRDCIKDNHNGTYTVTFPGAKDEPITVKGPTEAELGLYNRGSSNGVWASVLEKAYGQYRDNHAWFGANTPQEGADGGGRPEPVIKLFTGRESDNIDVSSVSQADMAKKLEAATANHKTVVTGINGDANWKYIFGLNTDQTDDKFYKQHEYTITGFIPDGHGGGTVEIRNPWGGKDGTVEGTIRIPLSQYMKNFSDVSIQK